MSSLYEKIEMLCKEHKESITTMCKASGASRGSLSDLKMGRINGLNIGTLVKIADHFGVSVDYFRDSHSEHLPMIIGDTTDSVSIANTVWEITNGRKNKKPADPQADEHYDPLMEPQVLFALFGGADNITPEMIEDVKQFAQYVRQKKEQQGK